MSEKSMKFEASMERLEAIVRQLEQEMHLWTSP